MYLVGARALDLVVFSVWKIEYKLWIQFLECFFYATQIGIYTFSYQVDF